MKAMRIYRFVPPPRLPALLSCVLTACLLQACVTINIYFPAAAVEKAADRIIDEIYQSKAGEAPPAEKK